MYHILKKFTINQKEVYKMLGVMHLTMMNTFISVGGSASSWKYWDR